MTTYENYNTSSQHGTSYDLHQDLVEFIINALDEKDTMRLCNLVSDIHAADLASLINIITSEQRQQLIRDIRGNLDPEVLIDLEPKIKDEVIDLLGAKDSAAAITQLESDDAVQVMEDLEEEDQQEILKAIPEEHREALEEGLSYPEETAGRIMNKSFVAVPENWNVGKTIDYLRKDYNLPDDFYEIFVLNKEKQPVGGVLVSRIIRKKRDVLISDIMECDLRTISVETDQEEVAHIFRRYALASAPVINTLGGLVGVISVDDVVDVIDEEAEEDIMRLGGIAETDLYSSSVQTAIHRSPWLFINLITAIIASAVIVMFESSIEKLVALAALMPIVASMAGNAGTQTLTIAVRAIAMKELTSTNAMRVVIKEIKAAVLNGIFLGAILGGVSFLFYHNFNLSIVLALSMAIALIVAAFAGAIIPLLFSRIGIDPAIASGVFLTTVTDITAFFIFLGLASIVLM